MIILITTQVLMHLLYVARSFCRQEPEISFIRIVTMRKIFKYQPVPTGNNQFQQFISSDYYKTSINETSLPHRNTERPAENSFWFSFNERDHS